MSDTADQKFSFGNIAVDSQANTIVIAGREKRAEPKLIALLVYFAQHPQQIISRQHIIDALQPIGIGADESVTQAIFALRNLLGDDAKQPRYIETIPKKGYRFLADVEFIETKKSVDENAKTTSIKKPAFTNNFFTVNLIVILSVVLILIVLSFAYYKNV